MKFMIIRAAKSASFLLLATFVSPLMAQSDYHSSGWYLGGNIGISTANVDEQKITQNLTNYSYTDEENDLGYKLFGGYQFNRYFALESGYFNLGKFDYVLSTPTGTVNGNIKIMGVNLDAVAILPITENFSAFGRVGANYAETRDTFNTTGDFYFIDYNPNVRDLNYKFGAGLQYALSDTLGVRIEAERYRINDAVGNDGDIDLFSVGLTYRFGGTKEEAYTPKEEEMITSAPKKEEVLVVVDAPKVEEKIKEIVVQEKTVALVFEDIHFEFDKSTLRKEAKSALKRNVALLNKDPNTKILIEGYASEIGTKEYNQALSERRAQSVRDYLVKEKLIHVEKISTIGYGDTKPAIHEVNPNNFRSKAAKANMRVLLKIISE